MPHVLPPVSLHAPVGMDKDPQALIINLLQQILEHQQHQTEFQRQHLQLTEAHFLKDVKTVRCPKDSSPSESGHPKHVCEMLRQGASTRLDPNVLTQQEVDELIPTGVGCILDEFLCKEENPESAQLPTGMPHAVVRFLVLICALPAAIAQSHTKICCICRLCPVILIMSHVAHGAYVIKNIYLKLTLLHQESVPLFIEFGLLAYQLLAALPLWLLWKKELSSNGTLLRFIQSLGKWNFPWDNFSPKLTACGIASVSVAGISFMSHVSARLAGQTLTGQAHDSSSGQYSNLFQALHILDLCGMCGQMVILAAFTCHIWVLGMICSLHKHELLSYTRAMTKCLIAPAPDLRLVRALGKLETHITARLNRASETWLGPIMCIVGILWSKLLAGCAVMLSANHRSNSFISTVLLYCVLNAAGGILLLYHLGKIDMAFEKDVCRALNNAHLLHLAQKTFGQQLLAHVKGLNWGLKLTKSNISVDGVSRLAVALTLGIMTMLARVVLVK